MKQPLTEPRDNYVHLRLTPREAIIVAYALAACSSQIISEAIDCSDAQSRQLIGKVERKVAYAREKAKVI